MFNYKYEKKVKLKIKFYFCLKKEFLLQYLKRLISKF